MHDEGHMIEPEQLYLWLLLHELLLTKRQRRVRGTWWMLPCLIT